MDLEVKKDTVKEGNQLKCKDEERKKDVNMKIGKKKNVNERKEMKEK